ncbi:endonuclease [Flavobacterium silvaticum]|uniref:Endonuclease n=1 Tax=Flavobacterium silvaticum TaxID=1852020 RepID=A0A972FJV5_9FLAO|nr:endonuclease [Flavobacterium silvaticum]NMH27384.1 endonuclease [Flavobacterium silvaticum]
MPEGPSLRILWEQTRQFEGKKVLEATGNAKIDIDRLNNKTAEALKTWGKHFLICFNGFYVRVHFLMIGSYSIDEKGKAKVRLGLHFNTGDLYFYASQVKLFEGNVNAYYDWSADIMSDDWDRSAAIKKIKNHPDAMICDMLLDQNIVAGSGNIIKNEALYLAKIHPESIVSEIPSDKLRQLLNDVRDFSFDFLKWKKRNELQKNLKVYSQKECDCGGKMTVKETGKTRRKSYFCEKCQKLYGKKHLFS